MRFFCRTVLPRDTLCSPRLVPPHKGSRFRLWKFFTFFFLKLIRFQTNRFDRMVSWLICQSAMNRSAACLVNAAIDFLSAFLGKHFFSDFFVYNFVSFSNLFLSSIAVKQKLWIYLVLMNFAFFEIKKPRMTSFCFSQVCWWIQFLLFESFGVEKKFLANCAFIVFVWFFALKLV